MLPVNHRCEANTSPGELGVGNKYITSTKVVVPKCRLCEPRYTKRDDVRNHGMEEIEDGKMSGGLPCNGLVIPKGTYRLRGRIQSDPLLLLATKSRKILGSLAPSSNISN